MKNICDWENCSEIGEYKAPVEKDNSKKYRLLCLSHVKEFNKNWNYFSGMNDDQVLDFLKSDIELVEIIKKRSIIYSKALYKINCDNLSKHEIAKKVIGIYETH